MENEVELVYNQLDEQTADFLREKEMRMKDILGGAYTSLGKELKDAQNRLSGSNQYNGVFEKWYSSLGFKKDRVYDLIHRYNLLLGISEDQKQIVEELPLSLSYKIAKPSANQILKEKVLNGEVKTLKEYKQLENELSQVNEEKDNLAKLLQEEKSKNIEIKEIEIDKTDYESILKLGKQLQQRDKDYELLLNEKRAMESKMKLIEKENQEFNDFKNQIQQVTKGKDEIGRQIEAATSISGLVVEVGNLVKEKLAPVKYSSAIREAGDSDIVISNLREIIQLVDDWSKEMKGYLPDNRIIDIEILEV